ncbi:MAG: hypothetical protein ACP6IU_12950 [Candidatus Asgardarchaeia archaeon]
MKLVDTIFKYRIAILVALFVLSVVLTYFGIPVFADPNTGQIPAPSGG